MSQMKEIHAVPVREPVKRWVSDREYVMEDPRSHDLTVDCWCEPMMEEYSDLVPGGAKRVVIHRDVEMPA